MHTFLNPSVESLFKSFQIVNLKLIIFKQESRSSVILYTYIGSTTVWLLSSYLVKCLGHSEFKTLLLLSSVFLQRLKFFLYQAIQPVVRAVLAQARVFFRTETSTRGSEQDLSKFQMAPIPFLSDLTCSTHLPHDILKVRKKMTITCLLGVSNVMSVFLVGLVLGFLSVFN